MLQKIAMLPELGTANAFGSLPINKVGRRGTGEAVHGAGLCSGDAWIEADAQLCEACGEPVVHLPVSLPLLSRCFRPYQCVGQPTGVEHSTATTGAAKQIQLPCPGEASPSLWNLPLMPAQGEGWPVPTVEAQHRLPMPPGPALLKQQGIQGHLFGAVEREMGQQATVA